MSSGGQPFRRVMVDLVIQRAGKLFAFVVPSPPPDRPEHRVKPVIPMPAPGRHETLIAHRRKHDTDTAQLGGDEHGLHGIWLAPPPCEELNRAERAAAYLDLAPLRRPIHILLPV